MKPSRKNPYITAAAVTLLAGPSLYAATATKTDTAGSTDLTVGAAWTGGSPVTSTDTAQWLSTSLGGTQTIGSAVTWGALDFEGSAVSAAVTINKVSGVGTLTLNGGQTINGIADSGLVVASTANGTTTLGVNLELGANQVWTTDGAKTVTFSPTNTTDLKGFTLDLNITGTASAQGALNNFNFNSTSVKNGTINANTGVNVNFSQNGNGNYSLGTDLKINVNAGSYVRFNGSTSGTQITDYSAEVHLKGGTLLFSGGNATTPTLASTGKLIVDNNSTISTQSTAGTAPTTVIAAAISGTGNLNIAPTSNRPLQNVILTNANSGYSGAWTLTAPGATGPTLTLADGGGLGDGSATNTVTLGTATTLAFTNATGPLSVVNAIGGAGQLTKSGAGMVTLSGANTYTGVTTVNGGTLSITGTRTNSSGGAVNVNTGILNLQNSNALGTSVVTAIARNSGIQLQGGISLPGTVTFVTSNDGTSTVPYAIANVSGDNTINGTISLMTGGGSSVIQSDSGSLTLAGNISIAAGQTSRGLILQGASTGANTVSGVISDLSGTSIASITKAGAGTWTVSGSNTHSGATNINAGTLITANNSALGTGSVSVANGAILQVGNGVNNLVTLGLAAGLSTATTDSTLKLGAANSSITMGANGVFSLAAGTNLDITGLGLGAGTYTLIDGTAVGSIVGAWDQNTDLIGGDLANFSYNFALGGTNDAILTVAAVPEPGAALLGGLGLLGLLRRRRN